MKQKLIQCKSDCDQEEDSVVLDLSDDESFMWFYIDDDYQLHLKS